MTAVRQPGRINDNTYLIPEEFRALLLPGLEGAVELADRTYKTNQP